MWHTILTRAVTPNSILGGILEKMRKSPPGGDELLPISGGLPLSQPSISTTLTIEISRESASSFVRSVDRLRWGEIKLAEFLEDMPVHNVQYCCKKALEKPPA